MYTSSRLFRFGILFSIFVILCFVSPVKQSTAADPVVSATVNVGLTPAYTNLAGVMFTLLNDPAANNIGVPVTAINQAALAVVPNSITFPNSAVAGKTVVVWLDPNQPGITTTANPLFKFVYPVTNGTYPRFAIDSLSAISIIGTPNSATANNFVISTSYLTQAGFTQFFLNYFSTGIGTGSVTLTSSAPNVACTGNCSTIFNASTLITLTPTADTDSYFAGWTGAGCGGTGNCQLTLNNEQSVSANFDIHPPVNLASAYFPLIGDAYKIAGSGNSSTIALKLRRGDLIESPVFANDTSAITKDLNVTLTGGFDGTFSSAVGTTNIHGSVTVTAGSVTVDKIVIM